MRAQLAAARPRRPTGTACSGAAPAIRGPARAPAATARPGAPSSCSTQDQRHATSPARRSSSTTAGAAVGAWPRISACLPWPSRQRAAAPSRRRASRPLGVRVSSGLRLRPQPARHRRVARQVEALLDGDHGRQRQRVDVAAAGHLLLAADAAAVDRRPLRARSRPAGRARGRRGSRPGSCPRRPTRCRTRSGRTRRRGRSASIASTIAAAVACGVPLARRPASRMRAVDAERHRVAQLLLGLGRPERQHDRLAAVLLDRAAPPPRRRTPRAG